MPELPEVESLRRSLEGLARGLRIEGVEVTETRLRRPVDRAKLSRLARHRRILSVDRRAKYLLVRLEGDTTLLIHLGMSGQLLCQDALSPRAKHQHICLALEGGRELRFVDPRRFGLFEALRDTELPSHPLLSSFGPEPLGPDFDGAALRLVLQGRRAAIKTLIMDARIVVGVGNIYASEALFRAGIRPGRGGGRLSLPACHRLASAIRETLQDAIDHGGTTLSDYRDAEGRRGDNQSRLFVYGRHDEPCLQCQAPIQRRVMAQRSTYYCRHCQR
ncbi:MAG: bifunctional DNA-formamidopyrimidine glycosylase/DNA-(apurinic or apyrimidinic site) lyase [Planctomycetes bacterium]|nr:bifunctional DNA-formamidopyrimidine glycosylase/DNA-(apurinic or apyrimidinic site) lyase [Planctomycetota bacterium]